MTTTTVKRGWDRTNACVKPDCSNPRGTTSAGVTSFHCQYHTDLWEARLRRLEAEHLKPGQVPMIFREPVRPPTWPPPPNLVDLPVCDRCGEGVQDWPSRLCEDCREVRSREG